MIKHSKLLKEKSPLSRAFPFLLFLPPQNRLSCRPGLIDPSYLRLGGSVLQELRVCLRLFCYRLHDFYEPVQRIDSLGLCRLYHYRAVNDQREVDRRRVIAVVDEPLGDVHRGDAASELELVGEYGFVHAGLVKGEMISALEPLFYVVGVEDGRL